MLNSAEHEILNSHKYKKISRNSASSGSYKLRTHFFLLTNVKMPTNVGILAFMSWKISCSAELSLKFFITSGPVFAVCASVGC